MPRYILISSPRFARDVRKLTAETQQRVLAELARLEESPMHGKKLSGAKIGQWRVRVGEYRIRYDVIGDTVHLHRVRHRRESYRD